MISSKPSQLYFTTAVLETIVVSVFYGITLAKNQNSDHEVYVLGIVGIIQAVFTSWFAYTCVCSKSMYGYFASMFTHAIIVALSTYRLTTLKNMHSMDKQAAYVTCGAQLFYLIEAKFVASELSWAAMKEMGTNITQHKQFKHRNLFATFCVFDLQATVLLAVVSFYYLWSMAAFIAIPIVVSFFMYGLQRYILGRGINYPYVTCVWFVFMLVQPVCCFYTMFRVNNGHLDRDESIVKVQIALVCFFAILTRFQNILSFALCYRDRQLNIVGKNNQVLLHESVYEKLGRALLDDEEPQQPPVVFAVPIIVETNSTPMITSFNSRSSPLVKTQQISLSPTESLPQIESFQLHSTLLSGNDEFDLVDPQSFSLERDLV